MATASSSAITTRHQREIAPARPLPFAARPPRGTAPRPARRARGRAATARRRARSAGRREATARVRPRCSAGSTGSGSSLPNTPTMANGSAAPSARPITSRSRQHDDLRQVDREHVAAGGAERLEGGDHVAPAVEMALHRIGDADAADQQRGEADQRQELREALMLRSSCGEALARVRTSQPASGSALRASSMTALARALVGRVVRQLQRGRSSAPGCRAGAGRSRAGASSLTSKRGPKPTPPASLSGSAIDHARISNVGGADADAVAELQVEPRQQRRIGGRAECAVALGQQVGHRHCAAASVSSPSIG